MLYDNSDGATSGTLNRIADTFSHLLVTVLMPSSNVTSTERRALVTHPGESTPIGSVSTMPSCNLTVSGTSFSMTNATQQRVISIIGFNFS